MKKKVAIFGIKGLPAFGGAARANEAVIDRLKETYDYTIYSISTHTDKKGEYNGYYQKVFRGRKGKRANTLFYYIKSTLHALFFANYDVVHVNHTSAGFIVPFLRLKYKVVCTARGIIPKDDNKWKKIDKFFFNISLFLFFRFSNVAVSVCKPHIDLFQKYTRKKILYIPNGVHINDYLKEKCENITFAAGRIISLKGAHTLIDALNEIKYTGNIDMIGSLEHTLIYKNELIAKSKNLNIKFPGLIKDKKELFTRVCNSKLFVFPSFNEGLSNMLLEVASLKTPLICSDIVENKAVFNEDEVLFFKTGDSFDLAKKIQWALNNYSEMEKKAELAFQKLKTDYLWEDIAKEYERIYDDLIH